MCSRAVDYNRLRPLVTLPSATEMGGASKSDHAQSLVEFTVLTYNILGQSKINRPSYPYCAKSTLKWRSRSQLLMNEIRQYNSDIVAFQEMDRFDGFWEPFLTKTGYDLGVARRALLPPPKDSEGEGEEGLRATDPDLIDVNCIGWKRDKFALLAQKTISLAWTTRSLGSTPNVAQIVALQSTLDASHALIVATSHLYWKQGYDHIRLIQMHCLLQEIIKFRKESGLEHLPIILAGDFNSDPQAMAMQALLNGPGCLKDESFEAIREESKLTRSALLSLLGDFCEKWPRFKDAHEHYELTIRKGSSSYPLPFTSYCLYKGILDYITYTPTGSPHQGDDNASATNRNVPAPNTLHLTPVALRVIPEISVLESEEALPNQVYASDHIALQIKFKSSATMPL